MSQIRHKLNGRDGKRRTRRKNPLLDSAHYISKKIEKEGEDFCLEKLSLSSEGPPLCIANGVILSSSRGPTVLSSLLISQTF